MVHFVGPTSESSRRKLSDPLRVESGRRRTQAERARAVKTQLELGLFGVFFRATANGIGRPLQFWTDLALVHTLPH